jgi:hypothetical protein
MMFITIKIQDPGKIRFHTVKPQLSDLTELKGGWITENVE